MKFSIPKLLINIGILKNSAELFQVELANKKVCLYNCKLQFICETAAVGSLADKFLFIDKVIYESPRFDSSAYPSLCVFGQFTRKSFSVARVKAV